MRARVGPPSCLLLVLALQGVAAAQAGGDLLVVNGRVFGAESGADAVWVRAGRIEAVGPAAGLRTRVPPSTPRLDAGGGLVLPGFHDAHAHLEGGGSSLTQLDVSGLTTLAAVQAAVAAYARAHPELDWIEGRGWTYDLVPSGTFPTRQALDEVVADRPVVLESYDGHATWASSRALALAGIDADTEDPPDGRVVREPGGGPQGTLLEAAGALLADAVPEPTREERRSALEAGLAHLVALGVTSVDTIAGDPGELELLADLERAGRLPLRVTVSLPLEGDLDAYAALRARHATPWLRVGFLKAFVDGVIESRTAFMLEPYCGAGGERGEPMFARDRLTDLVARAHERRFQVAVHAIGDAGVRLALDAFAAAARRYPGIKVRHRVEHIEVVDRADMARFAKLDVVASMQPYHARPTGPAPDDDVWSRNLGPERLARSFAWRDLRARGAVLAFGSDWPVMSADPLHGLAVAATRRDERGLPAGGWHAEQAIDLRDAVVAYTLGSAYAIGREADLGRLAPGCLADLVVLSPDADLDRPASLWQAHVAHVVVDGVVRATR